MMPKPPGLSRAVAAILCAVLSLILMWTYGGGVLIAAAGIILSLKARRERPQAVPPNPKTTASTSITTVGLAMNILSLVITGLVTYGCYRVL